MVRTVAPTGKARWLALVVLCAGALMIILDGTIVTVALPSIQRSLDLSPAGLAWVVNAYLIPFGGLLLLAGRLGDLIGRRRVFLAGLVIFTVASVACGAAGNQQVLIGARFVQGIGGALASAGILGMIVAMFPEPRERVTAIAVYSFVGAAGASIGVLAGGLLTQALNWHWIFLVNLPIGVAATILAVRLIVADRGLGLRVGADVAGAALVTAGLMLAVYTIVETGSHGWGSAHTLGFGAVSLVLLAGFVARQATAATPLLPLRMLRPRNLWGANLVQLLVVAGLFGFQFLLALYLQQVHGYGGLATGLSFLPTTAGIAVLSLGFSGRLSNRFGSRAVLLAGLTSIAAALLLLARVPVHSSYPVDVLPAMLLLGAGGGLTLPALMTLGMADATPEDSGLASGMFNMTQQVGGALGLAVLTTLAASRTQRLLAGGHSQAVALTGGYRLAFAVGAALVVSGILLATLVLRTRRAASSGTVEAAPAGTIDEEPVRSGRT
jgi:EmrB/QacA subfamily drug resistance transporter